MCFCNTKKKDCWCSPQQVFPSLIGMSVNSLCKLPGALFVVQIFRKVTACPISYLLFCAEYKNKGRMQAWNQQLPRSCGFVLFSVYKILPTPKHNNNNNKGEISKNTAPSWIQPWLFMFKPWNRLSTKRSNLLSAYLHNPSTFVYDDLSRYYQ